MRKPVLPSKLPQPGQGKRGPEGHIAYLLRQAGGAQRLRMERTLANLDVTPAQFVILTLLKAYPGISNADLARLALLTPQTVSVIVVNIEKRGLVGRLPHAVHGRIQHLIITPEGQGLLAKCRERVDALETALVAGLDAAQERLIRQWLVEMAQDGAEGGVD
jgi:DNA-binding MarR family transcriptional regulator